MYQVQNGNSGGVRAEGTQPSKGNQESQGGIQVEGVRSSQATREGQDIETDGIREVQVLKGIQQGQTEELGQPLVVRSVGEELLSEEGTDRKDIPPADLWGTMEGLWILKTKIEQWVPDMLMGEVQKKWLSVEEVGEGEVQSRDNVPAF